MQEMQRELEELRAKQLDDAENLDSQHRQQLIHAESQLAQVLGMRWRRGYASVIITACVYE